jgi:hypothetical protein
MAARAALFHLAMLQRDENLTICSTRSWQLSFLGGFTEA